MKTNLKELRKKAGWSNADDFAASLGMSAKTYRNYEQGARGLNLDVASNLCNALGCSLNDLILDEQEKDQQADPSVSELIERYLNMSDQGRAALMAIARDLEELFPEE